MSHRKFDHVSKIKLLEQPKTSEIFRRFEFLRGGEQEGTGFFAPDLREVIEPTTLVIAYPALREMYGADQFDDIEELIRADAKEVRELLYAPTNYVTGQTLCEVAIGEPERQGDLYLQPFTLTLHYYEAQDLY
jgi:hypothetical protein